MGETLLTFLLSLAEFVVDIMEAAGSKSRRKRKENRKKRKMEEVTDEKSDY